MRSPLAALLFHDPGPTAAFVLLLVPAVAIGLRLQRWAALGIVAALWSLMMLIAGAVGWLDGTDDLSTSGQIEASVVLILLPALAMSIAAVLLGRSAATYLNSRKRRSERSKPATTPRPPDG
jgi:hypothetical protein